MFKIQDICDIGPAEFIDRLIVVSYHAKIFIFGSQKAHQHKLCGIGILILIYHDITQTFLISLQDIRMIFEKFYCQTDQIIKIHGIVMP